MEKIKKIIVCILLAILITIFGFYFFYKLKNKGNLHLPNAKNMKITSSAFKNNEYIPEKYTCDGENVNPPLEIRDIPKESKSVVLVVDDPDAPLGNWNHWLVWNIDKEVSLIEEKSVPKSGMEGKNDFEKNSYGGPCPPSGVHHYHFKVFALDAILNIDISSKKREVEKAMNGHIVDWAEIVGLYKK